MVFVSLIEVVPELLYKHNCVIIPNFGGFITNFKKSGFEENRNLINPSCKKVAFNQSLTENDGLLVSFWGRLKGISYKTALEEVHHFSEFLKERLKTQKSFDFKNLGTFYLNTENNLIFVPYQGLNFLESSFGLYPVKIKSLAPALGMATPKAMEAKIAMVEENIQEPKLKREFHLGFPIILKAASIALLLAATSFSIYYLAKSKRPLSLNNKAKSPQEAAILRVDTGFGKAEPSAHSKISHLEYSEELERVKNLNSRLDSLAAQNRRAQESFNVIDGYYPNQNLAKKALQAWTTQFPNAILTDKTDEGYGILLENFFSHNSAEAFLVMLKQEGYKNIEIEKQVVIGK